MSLYQSLLIVKFFGVMGFAGGTAGAWLASSLVDRKRAVHVVASPSLLVTWCCGFALLALSGLPMFELWVIGGWVLSMVSNMALVVAVAKEQRTLGAFVWTTLPLLGVVALMVVKPLWVQVVR
jgi:hypothetical protein